MTPIVSISIDSTNDTASITIFRVGAGASIHVNQLALGDTAELTLNQADARAREKARAALQAALDLL